MSRELWLAEGFTSYAESLVMTRAGLDTFELSLARWAGLINAVTTSPAVSLRFGRRDERVGAVHGRRLGRRSYQLGQHVRQLLHARRRARSRARPHAAWSRARAGQLRCVHARDVEVVRQARDRRASGHRHPALHPKRPARHARRRGTRWARRRRVPRPARRRPAAVRLGPSVRAGGRAGASRLPGPADDWGRRVRLQPADREGVGTDAVRVARLPRRSGARRRAATRGRPSRSRPPSRCGRRSAPIVPATPWPSSSSGAMGRPSPRPSRSWKTRSSSSLPESGPGNR